MSTCKHKAQILKWAEANYEKSFGASVIVECWDDNTYADLDDMPAEEALEFAKSIAEIHDEQSATAHF